MPTEEQWAAIPGYEGRYEVSNLGSVRSLPHRGQVMTQYGFETTRAVKGRVLKPVRATKTGHVQVCLSGGKFYRVHVLVLLAFVGPRPSGCETLHLNHDASDNRLANLRYGTHSENMLMNYEKDGPRHKTHCKRGHLLGGDNAVPSSAAVGYRHCRACSQERAKAHYYAKKAEQPA